MIARLPKLLLSAAFTAAFTFVFIQLFIYFGYLLSNVDALLFLSSFDAARRFGSFADLQTFAFGQGFGSYVHPALYHAFWWLLDWSASVQLAYLFSEFLFFASVFAFAYLVSTSALVSGLAAFFATSFFFVPALIVDHFGTVAPQIVLQIGLAYLAVAAIGFGLHRTTSMIAGFALLLYVIAMDWMYMIFLVPFVGACLTGFALQVGMGRQYRPLAWLASGSAVTFALAYASGMFDAYNSFTLMSVRFWSSDGLLPVYPRSLLFWGGVTRQPLAIIVAILMIPSMLYLIWLRRPFFVFVCPILLVLLLLLAIADIDSTGPGIYWTLPALGYFERPLIPFYAVVIACALAQLVRKAWIALLRPTSTREFDFGLRRAGAAALILGGSATAAIILVFAWIVKSGQDLTGLVYRPPYYWERTIKFVKELPFSWSPGSEFSPYFLDATDGGLINECPHLHDPDAPPRGRYCSYMLNLHSARNFFEPHNLSDIQTLPMLDAALQITRRGRHPEPASLGIHANELLAPLKSLGVRYVAIDGMDASAMEVRDIEGTLVSLIDLGQITAADVSARSVEFAQLYRVAHVAAARLSGRAVVHDERNYRKIGSSLVPAYDFMLEYRPGAVVVQARSSGESIVYLPFQFSNCLQLTQQGEPRAELLRVNGAQAALYFVKNAAARISNALTYFGDSSCRRRDFMDVFRLGVWPEDSFDELVKGRRVPFLMQMYLNARLRLRDRILLENRSKPR